jgi:hypothetical protein
MVTKPPIFVDKQFTPGKDSVEDRRSATVIAGLGINAPGLSAKHRRWLLNDSLWAYTQADGKWSCRYRSEGVLNDSPTPIQHDHVYTRKEMIDCMLANRDQYAWNLSAAVGCLVTVEEHHRLSLQKDVSGWKRYEKAGVVVYDMKPDPKIQYRPWDAEPGRSVTSVAGENESLTPAEFIDAWFEIERDSSPLKAAPAEPSL